MNIIYLELADAPLSEPTNLLEDWSLDYSAFSLQHSHYINKEQLWKKFIRTNEEEK